MLVAAGLAAAVASGSVAAVVARRRRITFALVLAAPLLLLDAVLLARLTQPIRRSALFVRSAHAAQTLSRDLFRNGLELGHREISIGL